MRSKSCIGHSPAAPGKLIAMALLGVAGMPGTAIAGTLDLGGGFEGKYTLTLSYALAARTEDPADELVKGPISPATGLPTTINADDGDRNFDQGSLINNRVSALAELYLSRGHYGAVLRGDAFYDNVYHRRNDNDSPSTVNKRGDHDAFTAEARRYNGGRARVLDAYAYGDWALDENTNLNLRAGRQVVAWGEGLFFAGVASAQGPADATKANIPGVEIKNILLPVNQVAAQLDFGTKLSLMGYYHLQYQPTELEPVGSYFSSFDGVGPGAQFLYGFANPLAFPPAGPVPGAPPTVKIRREGDIEPSDYGQYGVGAKVEISNATNVGLYWLRYHNTTPQLQLNFGFAELHPGIPGALPPITTAPTPAPVSYNIRYFDGIDMAALSFSTRLGPANVAGEVSYRDGVDMLVNGPAGPTASRGELTQLLLSSIYTMPRNFLSEQIDLVGEAGYVHVEDVDAVGGSEQLTNDKMAWAYSLIATLNYRNLFQSWDLAVPITWAQLPEGRPAMAGSFGSLYGEDDRRLSVAARFTYLQNLQLGASYNAYLGSADATDRPYADRDYVALSVKYSY